MCANGNEGKDLRQLTGLWKRSLYSPDCLEEVFSETRMQPVPSLFARIGTKRGFESDRHRSQPQNVVVVLDKDPSCLIESLRITSRLPASR